MKLYRCMTHSTPSPAQVMLRWGLQRGTSVLPKSVNVDRLRSNIDIVGWQLTQEDFDRLSRLEPQVRVGDSGGERGEG